MSYCALIKEISGQCGVRFELNYPAGLKTTYGTGGNADGAFFPETAEQAKKLVGLLRGAAVPYVYLGAGSNVLVSDEGFSGAVIYSCGFKGLSVGGKTIVAGAGEELKDLIKAALYSSLGGLEF